MSTAIGARNKLQPPIRLTIRFAARELGVSSRGLTKKLLSNSILPGSDGKFSMRQIFDALNSNSSLERRANEARWQAKIDECELARIQLEEKRNNLIPLEIVANHWDDIVTTWFNGIRHTSIPQAQQRQLIDQCVQAVERKFPENGTSQCEREVERYYARLKAEKYEKKVMAKIRAEREQREKVTTDAANGPRS